AAKNEKRLLIIIIFTTGISSAFLVNDAVVLLYTPVVISICRDCKIDPKPYIIAEILAANTGSAMTITGNPQNMLIGINSGIPYAKFMIHLLPVSLAGMFIIYAVIKLMYREQFSGTKPIHPSEKSYEYNYLSMKFSAPVFALVIIFFFTGSLTGISIPVTALAGASLILLFGRVRPSTVIQKVDWVLILFFAALFIVVRGIDKAGIIQSIIGTWSTGSDLAGITTIHGLSLILSQIISNVPYTVFMIPILKGNTGDIIWLSLAAASTIAGNATIIGAMANLIVLETAEKLDVKITFFEFLKPGLIVTILSLAVSIALIRLQLNYI
ncbi:MAG TPA: SLC13 family permease, partial [Spirochaetota bacterium]|nr:SLC13 family permease [Spirochaetota bacterium]